MSHKLKEVKRRGAKKKKKKVLVTLSMKPVFIIHYKGILKAL